MDRLLQASPRRRALTGALAAVLFSLALIGSLPQTARSAGGKCPYCNLAVLKNEPTLDNTVAMRHGPNRIEYRCVYCAVAQANSDKYKGDVTILAPSEVKGKPVLLTRKGDKWSAKPATAVFVAEKAHHRYCQITYRALTGKPGFDAYVKKNARVRTAKPLTLAQLVQKAN